MQTEKKERQSNIELLRILLMAAIPIYHVMLYNGVWFHELNPNTMIGIVVSAAGAIPADYCFIAMSSYFFLKDRSTANRHLFGVIPIYKKSIRRFFEFSTLCLSMYVIKVIVLRSLFGYNNTEYFVDFYLMKGTWWYVYPYLCLILLYPYLNELQKRLRPVVHFGLILAVSAVFVRINYVNTMGFWNDCVGFLLVYLLVSFLVKLGGDKGFRLYYGVFTIACGVFLIGTCCYVKFQRSLLFDKGDWILKLLAGRYSFVAMIMGVSLFFFFLQLKMPYRKGVNGLAGYTMFVFLLQDTWMGVFWALGKCDNQYVYYSTKAFIFWGLAYLISTFAVAVIIGKFYKKWVKPLWERVWINGFECE